MSDIFYLSLKQQEETNYKYQIFSLLYTKLKAGFSYKSVALMTPGST